MKLQVLLERKNTVISLSYSVLSQEALTVSLAYAGGYCSNAQHSARRAAAAVCDDL